jgi:hypothetical protein
MERFKRKNKLNISNKKIVRLINNNGCCLATNRITTEGYDVNYMYREVTERDGDTGWRFFAGNEDDNYMAEKSNHNIYEVNTIANYSPEILEYLDIAAPCAFERIDGTKRFERIKD